jgi:hypothetical protein
MSKYGRLLHSAPTVEQTVFGGHRTSYVVVLTSVPFSQSSSVGNRGTAKDAMHTRDAINVSAFMTCPFTSETHWRIQGSTSQRRLLDLLEGQHLISARLGATRPLRHGIECTSQRELSQVALRSRSVAKLESELGALTNCNRMF